MVRNLLNLDWPLIVMTRVSVCFCRSTAKDRPCWTWCVSTSTCWRRTTLAWRTAMQKAKRSVPCHGAAVTINLPLLLFFPPFLPRSLSPPFFLSWNTVFRKIIITDDIAGGGNIRKHGALNWRWWKHGTLNVCFRYTLPLYTSTPGKVCNAGPAPWGGKRGLCPLNWNLCPLSLSLMSLYKNSKKDQMIEWQGCCKICWGGAGWGGGLKCWTSYYDMNYLN